MDLSQDVRSALFAAGTDAITFNAPLGPERATRLVEQIARLGPRSIVDLGCGQGELVHLLANGVPEATVVGVDTSVRDIETAKRRVDTESCRDRVRFEVADAATWTGPVDVAICIGASHAFGDATGMFARLAELVPVGRAFIGDGVWQSPPDQWCVDNLGNQPSAADLEAEAASAGWTVEESDLSTTAEWDAFEFGWADGARSVAVPEAAAFADQREREYREHYRGVLGFCWLELSR